MNLTRIQAAMEEGRPAFGTHCSNEDIGFYEMCGPMGYDYVWIDNEHAGITGPIIRNGIVGSNAGGCAAFVRVRCNDATLVKPVLENGPDGIIFPMVNNAEDADKAVKSCLYPPYGTRGFGPLRGINYGVNGKETLKEYIESANKSILKIIQIEHHLGVKNLEAILEVPGIDLVICGPMDLSASIGKIGELENIEVVNLMKNIMTACKASKKPYGLSIGCNLNLVKFWVEGGASFISMGTPYDYFRIMGMKMLQEMKSICSGCNK